MVHVAFFFLFAVQACRSALCDGLFGIECFCERVILGKVSLYMNYAYPIKQEHPSFVRLMVSSHHVIVLSSCGALLAISHARNRSPVFSSAKHPIRWFGCHDVRQYHILEF